VDAKSEIREFLISRRARVTPEQAGLRTFGGLRRVPGLRCEEVALLAGVSVDYYTRLERGNAAGVSESVLDALARALQLDDVERAHLFRLARAAHPSAPRRRRRAQQRIRPSVERVLDAMTAVPAFVRNGQLDILAANRLGRAFYSLHFDIPHDPVNVARFAFLDPRAQTFYLDWERVARDMVALLHAQAGREPFDCELSDLVGQLSTRSGTSRTLWATHNVGQCETGRQSDPRSARRRRHFHARVDGPGRRSRLGDGRVRDRARLGIRTGPEPARQLDRDTRRTTRPRRTRRTSSRPKPAE
jgi:transcriptional regulator with XRE-family HTH domain